MSKPSNSESVAQDQIRAFVERIMRMREEAKAINDDIREIYAEAKGNGFDKTVLGKLVLYVEKRATKADEPAEKDALFDLYLEAFDGRSSRTHAHEDTNPTPPASQETTAADPVGASDLGASTVTIGEDASRASEPVGGTEPQGGGSAMATAPGRDDRAIAPAQSVAAPNSEPVEGEQGEMPRTAAAPVAEGVSPNASSVTPTAADNARKIRPWCLHADDLSKCGGFGRVHCHPCLKAHADAEGIAA